MNLIKYVLPLLLVCSLLESCKKEAKKHSIENQDVTFTKEATLHLYKKDNTLLTTLDIEIANNDYERETGLMYRTDMEDHQGMLFIFDEEEPRYFYMKNTQIPLDILYIDTEKRIVSFVKNAAPLDETSLPSNIPAKYVLEINAGLIDQWALEIGDRITIN